ncbi:DUF4174 domain-containing protein, partial [Vibrio sp. FNV 38]|nr:DUF4174 domain-containing protein [Vibrio sp. FNV 38]
INPTFKSSALMTLTFVLSSFVFSTATWGQSMLNDIDDLKWKNRIILVYSESNSNVLYHQLTSDIDSIKERDIVWFLLSNDRLKTNYNGDISSDIIHHLEKIISSAKPHSFMDHVVLIGKDGGIKSRSTNLNLTGLYQQIDAMPMRQQEIRRQSEQ